jgi:Sec-independent protein translocase protein TatA
MFGFGLWELAVVLLVFLLLFPRRIVKVGRDLGESVGLVRKALPED